MAYDEDTKRMISMSELVTVKGFRNGVTLVLSDAEPDFQKVLEQLRSKLSATTFFQNTFVNVDIGGREALSPDELASLREILSSRNIQLKNVILKKHGSNNGGYDEEKAIFPKIEEEKSSALMVKKTIRSGQSLYYPGTVVLMGDVHPGGEIAAGENIIVWGSLRGLAHAGKNGDERAFIVALQLAPSQLRIAHYVACSPEQHSNVPAVPEIAYVADGRIVVEEYSSSRGILNNNGLYARRGR